MESSEREVEGSEREVEGSEREVEGSEREVGGSEREVEEIWLLLAQGCYYLAIGMELSHQEV